MDIISYITSPQLQAILLPFKIAFLVISSFFLGFIIFALLKTMWLKFAFLENLVEFFTYRPYGIRKITKQWAKTLTRLEAGSESEYKLAIIEVDRMLDDVLKRMGYPGANLEERLSQLTSATLSNIDQIRGAHQIRNNIIRDPDYRLDLNEAKRILEIYEQAFRDLQVF